MSCLIVNLEEILCGRRDGCNGTACYILFGDQRPVRPTGNHPDQLAFADKKSDGMNTACLFVPFLQVYDFVAEV